MSETFGQAYRQETEEVQGGSIAPPPADVSRKSVAQASAKGTVDSNFTSIGEPERKRIDNDSAVIMQALLSVAGTAADVITKEQNRKKALEGARMAGTAEGQEAIDGMSGNIMSQIFGPSITQRAGQEQIVKDSTISLNGKLTNDAGTIGIKMSDGEWNAHVDKTIASQTDKYDDEEIKDMITGDFSKRLGTIQSGWIKKSTIYRAEVARESYAKTVDQTFTQVAGTIDSIDPQVAADAQQAVRDIAQRPAGMTEEAHRQQLVDSMTQQLTKGNLGVYNAFKATGAFAQLDQAQQDSLSSMESAYNAKNDGEYVAGVAQLDLMATALNSDGSPRFSPSETLTFAEELKAKNPEAFAALGLQSTVNKIMKSASKYNDKVIKTNEQFRDFTQNPAYLGRTATPQEYQVAYTSTLNSALTQSILRERDANVPESGLPADTSPITGADLQTALSSNVDAYKNVWSTANKPSDMIGNFGNATYKSILQVEPEDAEDQGLVTSLRTLKELRDTDTDLFLKQFPDNGVQMMSLFKKMDEQGMTPWAAVTSMALTRDRLEARGGKPQVLTEADNEQKTKRLDKVKREFIDELTNKGLFNLGSEGVGTSITATSWAQNADPVNMSQLNEEFSRIYDEEFAKHPDSSEAADAARYRIQTNGVQVGPAFIINGVKAEEASGFGIEAFVQGISDDPDYNDRLTSKYGLPEGTDFIDQLRSASVSADGMTLTGWLASGERGVVAFQLPMPTDPKHMLKTDGEKRTELALDVLRTGRDVAYEAAHLVTTGSSPTDLNTPLKDTAEGAQSLVTKLSTGRDVHADIGAETVHQSKKRELEAFDSKQEQKDNTYHGEAAVKQVELQEGRPLTYKEKVVVNDEGYVNGLYPDTKGNMTGGVGQTKEFLNMTFDETLQAHERRIKSDPKKLPDYDSYPEWLQAELLSADYRGDIGQSPLAMEYARAGQWEKAAIEFLDNDEYLHPDTPKSIKARMRRTAAAMSRYGQQL